MPLPLPLTQPVTAPDGSVPVLPSLSRTTTQSVDVKNLTGAGVEVTVDISTIGTGSITLNIRAKDPVSGNYIVILASVALVANGTTRYRVYPGIAVVANQTASDTVPHEWNIQVVANNANPVVYSVSAALIG